MFPFILYTRCKLIIICIPIITFIKNRNQKNHYGTGVIIPFRDILIQFFKFFSFQAFFFTTIRKNCW